ncbi:MAG TPA: hypothetical protein VJ386_12140 [Candidatus Deferrimicrobiaceae bacterium]|jgi:hypothetical protein|nr:MAG: hypothetical protein A2Z13_09325 [Deltaproteobacteria bacterium RBG_16_64_85]HJX16478.1 hypothetical protein [Candidatus Deferrimicrobiaceae bacterium]
MAHGLVGLDSSRQDADVGVVENPHGAEGDFHLLFAVGRQEGAILPVNGCMDDPDLSFPSGKQDHLSVVSPSRIFQEGV